MQVAIAGAPGPLGRVDDPGDSRGVAESGGLIISSIQAARARSTGPLVLIDLAQQRRRELGLPELDGELGRREEAASPVRRIAELGGPSQRGDRHVKRTAAARAPPRLLELQRRRPRARR